MFDSDVDMNSESCGAEVFRNDDVNSGTDDMSSVTDGMCSDSDVVNSVSDGMTSDSDGMSSMDLTTPRYLIVTLLLSIMSSEVVSVTCT